MDYFKFDLQLFADPDVTVNLTNAADFLAGTGVEATTTKYVHADGSVDATATGAVASITLTVAASVITAREITIVAADAKTVEVSGATKTQLAGFAFATKTALSEGSATNASVSFADASLSAASVKGDTATAFTVTADGIQISQNVAVTVGTTIVKETAASKNITVGTDGVIKNFSASGAAFSVSDGKDDSMPTTYTATVADSKVTLTVTGDEIGVYKQYKASAEANPTNILDTLLGKITVTPAAGKDAVKVAVDATHTYDVLYGGDLALVLKANSDSLAAADTKTPKVLYYAVTESAGTYTVSATASAAKGTAEAVAYFRVTYDPGYTTKAGVKVELVDTAAIANEKPIVALGEVSINATAVKNVIYNTDKDAPLTSITLGDGLSVTGTVNVTGIAKGAALNRGTGNADGTTDYAPWYTLDSSANAITLAGLTGTAEGTYYFFEINPAAKVKATGEVKYSIARDTTANRVYSLAEGKVKYKDGEAAAVAAAKSGFLVKVTSAGVNTVAFYAGTNSEDPTKFDPANLNEKCWNGITVGATGLAATSVIDITPKGTNDHYALTTENGVTVKNNDTPIIGNTAAINVTRTSASVNTTFVLTKTSAGDITASGIPLNEEGKWVVTRNYEASANGNPTITIQKTDTPAAGSSFITVAKDAITKTITVTYTDGAGISLNGLKTSDGTAATQVLLNPASVVAGWTLDMTDNGAIVDYKVTDLARGVTVKGKSDKDIVTYIAGTKYNNDVAITLSGTAVEAETITYYQVMVADTADATTGLTRVYLNNTPFTPANLTDDTYFKVVQTPAGAYTVSYNKGTSGPDLTNTSTVAGQVTVNASAVTNKDAMIALTNGDTINAYAVTNVIHGGLASIEEDGGDISETKTSYKEPVEYALTQAEAFNLDGDVEGKKYAVTAENSKGITTYKITAASVAPGDNSYFKVAYDAEKGTMTLTFEKGEAAGAVTLADFSKNLATVAKSTIAIAADDGLNKKWTTLVLTDDKEGAVKYAVENLPSTVATVTNAGTGDTVAYKETYQFAEGKNKLSLSKTEGVVYYEVTATGGQSARGIFTCSIGSALAATGADEDAKDASVKTKNYFKVNTSKEGNVTVTYHAAEQPETGAKVTSLALEPKAVGVDALIVEVDPTGASSTGAFTFGEAAGPVLTYNVTGLTSGQTAEKADGSDDTVTRKYDVSYKIVYVDGEGNLLANQSIQLTGDKKYYSVIATVGSTTTTEGKGITTFTVKEATEGDAKAAGAYFMVKYSSAYQANITYVNALGESMSLTREGVPQVVVDADGLAGRTYDTLNITDAAGGDYNGVNYALINVPEKVKDNPDGVIGLTTGDTVSYKEAAKLTADQSITVDPTTEVTYYTLKAVTTSGATTYSIDKALSGKANKPADTVNYFYVTKADNGDYTVAYHMANGDGLSFAAANITVDANKVVVDGSSEKVGNVTTVSPGTVTITNDASMGAVNLAVTNAPGGVTLSGTGSISYDTTFAWTPGTYFISVKDGSTAATVATGAASGDTKPGSDQQYVKVTVKTVTTTDAKDATKKTVQYQVVPDAGGKTFKAAATTGVMDNTSGEAYSNNNLTVELPTTVTNFDAGTVAFGEITGVKNGDVVTGSSVLAITTGSLKANNAFTVGTKTFTLGADGKATVTGAGAVKEGTLKLATLNDTLTGSLVGAKTVKFVAAATGSDGVIVTFKGGKVDTVTDLELGEAVDIGTDHYEYEDAYHLIKVDNLGKKTYAAATTGDLLSITDWSDNPAQQVGQALDIDSTSDNTAYITIGTATTNITVKDQSANPTDAVAGTYYVKATTSTAGLKLSVVKANAQKLMEPATDYKGVVTVDCTGTESFKYIGNAKEDDAGKSVNGNTYKTAFTNVTVGANLSKLDSGDTIETVELANTQTVVVETITYAAKGAQKFKFTGGGLTDGLITVTGVGATTAKPVAKLPEGVTVTYAAIADETATITAAGGKITSIKDLGTGETVSINDGTTITSYTSTAATKITKTVKTIATSETVTYTATLEAADGEVLKDITYTAGATTYNNDFAWADGKSGFFAVNTATSPATATVNTTTPSVDMVENYSYMKAEVTKAEGSKNCVLKLTPYMVKGGKFTPTSLYNARVTVNASALTAGDILTYTANGQTYNVTFTSVTKGSNLKLAHGDTVETVALAVDDTITLNGQTVTSKAAAPATLYSTGSGYGVITGTVLVDGTMTSFDDPDATTALNTLTYTAGTAAGSKNGVIVEFTTGNVTQITDMGKGEIVKIVGGGTTTVYEAITATVVARTIGNETRVADFTGDVVNPAGGYVTITDLKEAFSWTDAEADPNGIGYFLVDANGNATVANTDKDTVIATYRNAGATLVKATYTRGAGNLAIAGKAVDKTGAVGADAELASLKTLNVNVTGSEPVVLTKVVGVKMNVTGVGTGSQFSGFVAGDSVTTASLAAGNTIKFGTTTYTAGAKGALSFNGDKAYAGTFQITNAADFVTSVTDDSTKITTDSTVHYTPGPDPAHLKDGALVGVTKGEVSSILDLELGEQVQITTTVTYKDGSTGTTVTTYEGTKILPDGSQKGMLQVTRTVNENGVVTTSTQAFKADGSQNVGVTTGWSTTEKATTSYFQFGDTSNPLFTTTGYFTATLDDDPSHKTTYGKYSAPIATQDSKITLDGGDAGYYLKATATKDVTGAITFSEMELMKLETTGTWTTVTDKELYMVTIAAPASATITLADHSFPVTINASGNNSKFANVNATDVVKVATPTAADVLVVNNVSYTTKTTDSIEIVGGYKTSAVKAGVLIVKEQAAKASVSGDTISYDKGESATPDGVIVTFANGKISTIKDLEDKEKVTVTSADGTVTTYECKAVAANNVYTKTIKKDGLTSTWTFTKATAEIPDPEAFDVMDQNYGVSPKFAWPTETGKPALVFAKVAADKATIAANDSVDPIAIEDENTKMVRAVVEKDKTGTGYTITSLKLLKGPTLEDVTGELYNKGEAPATTTVAVDIKAPAGAGLALASTAIVLPENTDTTKYKVSRNVQLNITNASAGQSYTGLDDTDTVTTAQLAAGNSITVNKTKFAAAGNGQLTVSGKGEALSGAFTVSKAYTVAGRWQTVTMTAGEAMVVMVGGSVQSIFQLNSGETVTLTDKDGGVVTYTGKTVGGKLEVTRKSVVDGVTTIATATVEDGDDILYGVEYVPSDTGNTVTSKFDWTEKGGTGYFLVTTTTKDGVTTGTATIEPQPKAVNITKADVGKLYAQVLIDEYVGLDDISRVGVDGIYLYEVQSNGTLKAYTEALKGALAITAPTAKPLSLDLITGAGTNMPNDANVAVSITGATKNSEIVLGANDTLTTASLGDGDTIKVNNDTFTAGGTTTLKFGAANDATATSGAILSGGTVKFTAAGSFKAAGADNKVGTAGDDGDNVTVTYTLKPAADPTKTKAENPVVTVTNGIVTAISGFTNNGSDITTASADGVTVKYTAAITYKDGDQSKDILTNTINAAISGTLPAGKDVTLAALDEGAAISGVAGNFVSGAANNNIVIVKETAAYTIKGGVLKLGNGVTFTATGASTEASDNVIVQQTAGTGTAVVTVNNGQVASITKAATGDTVTVTKYGSSTSGATTTYSCEIATYVIASGTVTRTVKTGTGASIDAAQTAANADPGKQTTAYISGSSDLLAANYFSATDNTTDALVGQFSWSTEINGRQTGYFKMATKTVSGSTVYTGTVAEQPTEVAVVAPAKGTLRYAVGNVENGVLTLSGLDVTKTGSGATATTTYKPIEATDASFAGSMITITAPTDQAITYDKNGAKFSVTVNKLAKKSSLSNLDTGDKVLTNTLAADEYVVVDGRSYVSGAKGTMTFVGEGDDAATPASTAKTALLTGTVKLGTTAKGAGDVAVTSVILSGASEKDDKGDTANDLTVSYDGNDEVVVKTANGVVTSITGLKTGGNAVTISDGTKLWTYDVIDAAGTMIRRRESTVAQPTTYTATSYKTIAVGKEIYSKDDAKNGYVAAPGTALSDLNFATPSSGTKTTTGIYKLAGTGSAAGAANMVTADTVEALGDTLRADGKFDATPDNYYLKVVASTNGNGVTTIKSVDLMKAGATGALAAVKSTTATYGGMLTLSGAVAGTPVTYAKLNYSLPKTRNWQLTVTDAGLGSTFTNLGSGDQVSTVTLDTATTLAKGNYVLYHADTTNLITEERKVQVTGDGVSITTNAAGTIATLTGLNSKSEKVVITETTAAGLLVTEYAVDAKGAKVTKTETLENGTKTVKELTTFDANTDMIAADFGTAKSTTVAWNFDWTTKKNVTGYFTAKNGVVTAAAGAGTIKATDDGKDFIAVTISSDGVVSEVSQMKFSATAGMVASTSAPFSGTINIKAPTGLRLSFNRNALDTAATIAEGAKVAVAGAAASSVITNLTAGDTVATAGLAKGAFVTVNDGVYNASTGGALSFLVQNVGTYGDKVTLTKGTALIASTAGDGEGLNFLYAGKNVITATRGNITVAASTNSQGTSFTIGDLGENETFTVEDTSTGVTYTYQKSGTTLLRTYNNPATGDPVNEIYAIGSAKTITSAIMGTASKWKDVVETFTVKDTGEKTTEYGVVTTNLALADTYIKNAKADAAKNNVAYLLPGNNLNNNFVLDTYLASGTKKNSKAALNAAVVRNQAAWQTMVGLITVGLDATGKVWSYTFTAVASDIGQSIKATAGWDVTGSNFNDTIAGAASGTATITGGMGDDSITAGGAAETFKFDLSGAKNGRDTLKGYAAGKDKINVEGDFTFQLDTASGGNVFLFVDGAGANEGVYDKEEEGVALMAVAGKALTINDRTFYFGNGALAKGKTQTTAGSTFTYADGAYYIGNDSGKNMLKVATDKTKASKTTLGDTVVVDLNRADEYGHSYYTNITSVDASASANTLMLVASATGSLLKGGTYQSTLAGGAGNDTLQGGSGADVFWFKDGLDGVDTIKTYTSKNDAVYLGDWNGGGATVANGDVMEANGMVIKADGNNVVLSNSSGLGKVSLEGAVGATKAIRFSTDGTATNTLSYYVGSAKSGAANTFTAISGTDMVASTEDSAYKGADGTTLLKDYSYKSYYVGSSATTKDVLKLSVVDEKKRATAVKGVFSLQSTNLSSIDTLDASGLAAGSTIALIGADTGTCTLKGSTNAKTTERFVIGTATKTIVQNLTGVGDVIELAAGVNVSSAHKDGKNVIYTLDNGTTLQVDGVTLGTNINATATLNTTTGKYEIRRTK